MPRSYNKSPDCYAAPGEDIFGRIQQQMPILENALLMLQHSLERCSVIEQGEYYTPEELEKLEALKNRFITITDMFLRDVLPLADKIDREVSGTVIDQIRRAEKKKIIHSAETLIKIRNLRYKLERTHFPVSVNILWEAVTGLAINFIDYYDGFLWYAKSRNYYLEPEVISLNP